MKLLGSVDSFLIDKFAQFAAAIQRWIGVDCLAQGIALSRVACLLWAGEETSQGSYGWSAIFVFNAAIQNATGEQDEHIRSGALRGFRNSRQKETIYIFCRWGWLLLSAPMMAIHPRALPLANYFGHIGVIAMTLASWFRCCDPLPPCDGKVREWWDSLGRQLVPVRITK